MQKKAYQVFFRTKISGLFLGIALFFLSVMEYKYSVNVKNNIENVNAFNYLSSSLELVFYIFTFFLIISYFYFATLEKSKMQLTLPRTQYIKLCKSYRFVMYGWVILVFLSALFWNLFTVWKKWGQSKEFLMRVFLVCVLYYFVFLILAVIIGEVATHFEKRINAVLFIMLIVLLVSPAFEAISHIFIQSSSFMYDVVRWFQVGPRNLRTAVDTVCGISAHWTRYAISIMWIMICFIYLGKKQKQNIKKIMLYGVIALGCGISYINAPWFGDELINSKTIDIDHCFHYYKQSEKVEYDTEKFDIDSYLMEYTIKNQLYANVTVSLSRTDLEYYYFTLHHQYKVDTIVNSKGEKLNYERYKDTIKVSGENITTDISFQYHGNAAGAYANEEWITLQSEFCFYPQAGIEQVYDSNINLYKVRQDRKETYYEVYVKTDQSVYCNLDSEQKNVFKGNAEAITLRAGFLKEYTYKDVTFIYPYLSSDSISSQDVIEKTIEEFYKYEEDNQEMNFNNYTIKGKKVFIGSECNLPDYFFYGNYIEMPYASVLPTTFSYYKNFLKSGKNSNKIITDRN